MDEDLVLGDLGAFDAMGLSLDIPEPTIENPEGVSSDLLGPSSFTATVADLGLSPSIPSVSTEDGLAGAFDGSLAVPEGEAGMMPILPDVTPPPSPEPPPAFSAEAPAPETSFPMAAPGQASSAGPVLVEEGLSSGLAGLPGLEIPLPPESPFLGASTPPEELLDLHMAMTPPPPAQEGFSVASDAPMAAPAPRSTVDSGPVASPMSLAQMQSISDEVWGAPSASQGSARGVSFAGGPAIHVENLHLPGVDSNAMIDQLLSMSRDLTNADLRELA